MQEEEKSILSKIKQGDFLVVLDEKGEELGSRQLAVKIQKWMERGVGRIVFIIGGAFGISPELKKRTDFIFSVSKLTFTHQMVRLILVEQIYRSMTILRNEGYHHD
jgi:23S rRNA (pseudouridine1915-N3)-methyltransferase